MRKYFNQPDCFPVILINKWHVIFFVILFSIIQGGCNKDNQTDVIVPVVITGEIHEINQQSATCKGQVTSEGSSSVSAKGICYNTSGMPTTSDQKTTICLQN